MPQDFTYSHLCPCARCARRRQSAEPSTQPVKDWSWVERRDDTRAIRAAQLELRKMGFVNEWDYTNA